MKIFEILKVVLVGIVEGITEWLPISSTGHLIIIEEYIDVSSIFLGGKDFWDIFLVAVQLGAVMAVVTCNFSKFNIFNGIKEEKNVSWLLWAKVIVACLPAAFIGLLFGDYLDEKFYNYLTVAAMLIVYGIIFMVIKFNNQKIKFNRVEDISFSRAFLIGLFQVLALIPGTSRSGVTILGAMFLFCSKDVACEFSFFLAVPVMVGASLIKFVKYFVSYDLFFSDLCLLFIGMIVAYVVSLVVIKWLLRYIKSNDFRLFGVYRIILGIILILIKIFK